MTDFDRLVAAAERVTRIRDRVSPYALTDKRITDEVRAEHAAAHEELRAAALAFADATVLRMCSVCGHRWNGHDGDSCAHCGAGPCQCSRCASASR